MRRTIAALGLTLAVLSTTAAQAPAAQPIYGVVPQDGALPEDSDLDLMPAAGITGLRTMLSWPAVEAVEGQYDWSAADALVRGTSSRGIQPLFFLYGLPAWAAHRDGRSCEPAACSVYAPRSPAVRAAFAAFARAAAQRYGPGGAFWTATTPKGAPCGCTTPRPIRVWQIWNEMNTPKYFAPKVNVPQYARILKDTSFAIRSVDPGAEIVLGGMWGPYSARSIVMPTNEYLERLYDAGARPYFDSIALHPYGDDAGASVAQLRTARRTLIEARDPGAGMWVTEIGWAARGPRENPYVKGMLGQAQILTEALSEYERLRRSLKLRGVFWYSWRDKPGGDQICEWCGGAGLRTKSGAEKPAWRAFVRIARR